jgi:hypothetical protein
MLKLTIEESKIIKLISATIKELEKGFYIELRSEDLDNYIKKINLNIHNVEEILDEFLLKKGIFNKIKNLIWNDTFGSLYQFKIELLNRFNCEEVKITTNDNVKLDA